MMNTITLVGRLTKKPDTEEINGKSYISIVLGVGRPFKDENGEFKTDFISCYIGDKMSDYVKEYVNINDVIGVKGRLKNNDNKLMIMVDKLTFLSSRKPEEIQ